MLGEIFGGDAYRKEMNKLIRLGKTYSLARMAVAKANAELAEMIMRERSSRDSVKIYEQRVKRLGDKAAHDATISQLAFGKILDAKRSVYLAMESYRRAFIYFTLVDEKNAPVLPKYSSNTDEFSQVGARIVGNRLSNESLSKPPQPIPPNEYSIPNSELPKSLFKLGSFTLHLLPDWSDFDSMYRIRLRKIRIFFDGLICDGNVKVNIATSGVYSDKTGDNKVKRFTGPPLRMNFIYDGKDPSTIRQDGGIAERYKNDFFLLTPFTEWTISVTDQKGNPLDCSTITAMRIQFSGEASSL